MKYGAVVIVGNGFLVRCWQLRIDGNGVCGVLVGCVLNVECVLPFLDPVAVPVVPPAKAGAGRKVVSLSVVPVP